MSIENLRPRNYQCLTPDCNEAGVVVSLRHVDRKFNAVIWPNDPECVDCGQKMHRVLSDD